MLDFRSDQLPAGLTDAQRFSLFHDLFQQTFKNVELKKSDAPFSVRMANVSFGDVLLHHISGSLKEVRAPNTGNGRIGLVVNTSNDVAGSVNRGREAAIGPGGAVLISRSDRSSITAGGENNSWFVLDLPETDLLRAVPGTQGLIGAAIDPANEALALIKSSAAMFVERDGFADQRLVAFAGQTMLDLVTLAVGAANDAAATATGRGLRAARLSAILQTIAAGYCSPSLSVALVARKHRVSERYVQDLLHGTGQSFCERVMELRLQHAARLLARIADRDRKISDVAFSSGFNDLSYFHRCYRRRFGTTPAGARVH